MEEITTPPTSRELASRGETLPIRAEDPITVVQHRRGPHPAVYLAVGLVIGVGGTVFAMGRRGPSTPVVRRDAAPVSVPVTVTTRVGAQSLNPNGPAEPSAPVGQGALTSNVTPEKKDGNEPLDPFDNGMLIPTLPVPKNDGTNPFRGMILPRQFPAAPPAPTNVPSTAAPGARKPNPLDQVVAQGIPKAPPALPIKRDEGTPKATQSKAAPAGNVQQKADDLIAYVAKAGGKGHALTEKGDGDKPVVRGVQATVPENAVAELVKYAASIGATVVDRGTADSAERGQRLAQEAESRLASLKKLREALLVTYVEDAQPVKDVDAEIAAAQKAIDEAKTEKTPEKMAVVKFSFAK